MPTFLNLSNISINVDTIRYVVAGAPRKEDSAPVCVIYFVDSSPTHTFYGSDAEAVLAFVKQHAPHVLKNTSAVAC